MADADTNAYFTCPDRPGFLAWGLKVDAALEAKCGMGVLDLPDWDYSSAYEDMSEPDEVADEVLADQGF